MDITRLFVLAVLISVCAAEGAADGGWGSWSAWMACDVTCGMGGRFRDRQCDSPPPEGGDYCPGEFQDDEVCDLGPCAVDGVWGPWGAWMACDVTCEMGARVRDRQCDSPPPVDGGDYCLGDPQDLEVCDLGPCAVDVDGVWGPWGAWISCDVTCGSGTRARDRQCDSPAPSGGGDFCPGSPQDILACDAGPCDVDVDGVWGPWGAWVSCDVTCGSGVRARDRQCDSPAPSGGGDFCPGSPQDILACDAGPCIVAVDGAWGTWGVWSCTVTCGEGSEVRNRACDAPAPLDGGLDCPGEIQEIAGTCNDGGCPVDGLPGTWAAWGTCTVTCGGGTMIRARPCDSPPPQHGGADCTDDQLYETDTCNEADCPGPCHACELDSGTCVEETRCECPPGRCSSALDQGCDLRCGKVGKFCDRQASRPCWDDHAACTLSHDLTGRFHCTCPFGYVQVDGDPVRCQRVLSVSSDEACTACVANTGVCWDDVDNPDGLMDGCVCPPTRVTNTDDCDTPLFMVECDAESMTVCYQHSDLSEHLAIFSQLLEKTALLYTVGKMRDLSCHLSPVGNDFCLTLSYGPSANDCGLLVSDATNILSYTLEVTLQTDVMLESRDDIYLLAFCTYDKIKQVASTAVRVVDTSKPPGVEGVKHQAQVTLETLDERGEDAQNTGLLVGQFLKLVIEMTEDAGMYTGLRPEVCLLADQLNLNNPATKSVPILVDGCPNGPIQDAIDTARINLKRTDIAIAHIPRFTNEEYIFIHCAVQVCVKIGPCDPKACEPDEPDEPERRRRSLPDMIPYFDNKLEHKVAAIRLLHGHTDKREEDTSERLHDNGPVADSLAFPLWAIVGAFVLPVILTLTLTLSLYCQLRLRRRNMLPEMA